MSSSQVSPSSILFARGLIARLSTWPALRVAVDQGWGGPESAEKRTWLASVIVDTFEEEDTLPDAPYVETMLLQVLDDEFDLVLEDDSAEQIAKDVMQLWAAAQANNTAIIIELEEKAEKLSKKKVEVQIQGPEEGDDEDWESESEGDEEEAPTLLDSGRTQRQKPEVEVDEDGFTTVKGKGQNHK
ncbi:Pre-rRNA-processing protein TSR2-domain-containing protein [Abortiporus biennis]|nr:Pre-rRNA-processing protein TSR2-domain-containing protein [Abortiporus biennis]